MSFITIYAGLFLFSDKQEVNVEPKETTAPFPIIYKHVSTIFSGNKQEINILEIDLGDKRVSIKPALSYDNIFGFELLSSIAMRNKAYAIVNAGFFYKHGNPSGMVSVDGKIISKSTGKYPVLSINKGLAELNEIKLKITLSSNQNIVNIDSINEYNPNKGIILYTSEFGSNNRINTGNISVIIKNNLITSIDRYVGEVKIPKEGMVLTFLKPYKYSIEDMPLKVGDRVKLEYAPSLGEGFNAYECGSWIVKTGKVVIGVKDPWVGVMTNHDPRTIVGIKNNGHLVLMTIDGRQPGHSIGMTGKELAAFILDNGISNAAMLDGGASTEMIVEGKIVNKTSAGGQERPVGGGIVVRLDS